MSLEKFLQKEWESTYATTPLQCIPWEAWKPEPELVKLVEAGEIKKGARVLDNCCGLATNSIYLARKGFQAYGLDIASNAIRIAEKRAKQAGAKCSFFVGNAYQLPYEINFFDFVLDRGCFHHIPSQHRKKYVEGIHRVLKKNGKFLLLCFSEKNHADKASAVYQISHGKTFSEKRIRKYFSPHFKIKDVHGIAHQEPSGGIVYLNSAFMAKK